MLRIQQRATGKGCWTRPEERLVISDMTSITYESAAVPQAMPVCRGTNPRTVRRFVFLFCETHQDIRCRNIHCPRRERCLKTLADCQCTRRVDLEHYGDYTRTDERGSTSAWNSGISSHVNCSILWHASIGRDSQFSLLSDSTSNSDLVQIAATLNFGKELAPKS